MDEIIDIPFPAEDPTWELSQIEEVLEKNIKEMQYELSIIASALSSFNTMVN